SFYNLLISQTHQSKQLKIKGFKLPSFLEGVDFSDHWSFEQFSYEAVLYSDSAFYRSNHYHQETDLYPTLNYDKLAEFKEILQKSILSL
ncbi:hypothetical protein MJH12_05385, partial [bacterium]|nr:hypothetical protein [bacterium]